MTTDELPSTRPNEARPTKFDQHQSPAERPQRPEPEADRRRRRSRSIIVIFIVANDHDHHDQLLAVHTWHTTVRWSIFIAILLGVALDRLLICGLRAGASETEGDDAPTPTKD